MRFYNSEKDRVLNPGTQAHNKRDCRHLATASCGSLKTVLKQSLMAFF